MLEKGPKWFWIPIDRVSESGNVERKKKKWSTEACLYFCYVFSLPFFLPLSFFFCYLVLSSFLLFSPFSFLPFSWLPLFLFILLDDMGFLPFVPKAPPTVFGFFVGISPRLPTNSLVARPLPLLKACLPHHSPSPDKIPYFVSLLSQFLPPSIDKD